MNRQAFEEYGTVQLGGEQFELFESYEHDDVPTSKSHEGRNESFVEAKKAIL